MIGKEFYKFDVVDMAELENRPGQYDYQVKLCKYKVLGNYHSDVYTLENNITGTRPVIISKR